VPPRQVRPNTAEEEAVVLNFDTSSEFGTRVARRLDEDRIGWLTTVDADGTPQPSPVWFLWDGATLLVYSEPNKAKLRNIERNPRVAFNLHGNEFGGDIVILIGEARVAPDAPPASAIPAYVEKYRVGMERIGMSAESFAASYSVAIRITPEKLRGH
jgi:PPOX class probable F420-dependent enzyme